VVTDIWTIASTDARVTKTIENLTFVKMVFPATDGTRWDGHVFFDDEEFFPVAQENLKIYGLVERYMEIFDSQNRIESEAWVDSAEKGFFLHQTLTSFTKN